MLQEIKTDKLKILEIIVKNELTEFFSLSLQGVMGDPGERGPPGPDGNEVR